MARIINSEIKNNTNFYRVLQKGSTAELASVVKEFFSSRKYHIDIVDLTIQATAVALKFNVFIHQNRGHIQICWHHAGQGIHDVHLKSTFYPKYNVLKHCDIIFISSKADPSEHQGKKS